MDKKEFSFNKLRNSEYDLSKYISEQMDFGERQDVIVDELNQEFVKEGLKTITPTYASRLKSVYSVYIDEFGVDRELLEGVSFRNLDELKPFATNQTVATEYVARLRKGDSLLSILEGIDNIRAKRRAEQIKAKKTKRNS